MPSDDRFRQYSEAGEEFVEAVASRMVELLREVTKVGQGSTNQASGRVTDLVETGRRTTEALLEVVRREVSTQLAQVGIGSRADLEALVARLTGGRAGAPADQPATAGRPTTPGSAAPAAKSPAAKSPAAKSPAAKSPAAKRPAVKAPAAKVPATPVPPAARKSASKAAPAKKATATASTGGRKAAPVASPAKAATPPGKATAAATKSTAAPAKASPAAKKATKATGTSTPTTPAS